MRWSLFIIAVAAIAGCAPSTIQGLRDHPAGQLAFEVEADYRVVYRRILTPARDCFQTGLVTGQQVVQGDLYPDIRQGNVTVAVHGGTGVDTYLTIDIVGLADHRTRVTTYYAVAGARPRAEAVEQWVKRGSTACVARPDGP